MKKIALAFMILLLGVRLLLKGKKHTPKEILNIAFH
jgi:hypothetical protein